MAIFVVQAEGLRTIRRNMIMTLIRTSRSNMKDFTQYVALRNCAQCALRGTHRISIEQGLSTLLTRRIRRVTYVLRNFCNTTITTMFAVANGRRFTRLLRIFVRQGVRLIFLDRVCGRLPNLMQRMKGSSNGLTFV